MKRFLCHAHFVWLELALMCVWTVWLLLQGNLTFSVESDNSFTLSFIAYGTWHDTTQLFITSLTFINFIFEVFVKWRKDLTLYPVEKKRVFLSHILDDDFTC